MCWLSWVIFVWQLISVNPNLISYDPLPCHRTRDSVSNFRLRVRLRKAASTSASASLASGGGGGAATGSSSRGSTESVRSADGTEDENEGLQHYVKDIQQTIY